MSNVVTFNFNKLKIDFGQFKSENSSFKIVDPENTVCKTESFNRYLFLTERFNNNFELPLTRAFYDLCSKFDHFGDKKLLMESISKVRNGFNNPEYNGMDLQIIKFKENLKRYFNTKYITVVFDKETKNLFDIFIDIKKNMNDIYHKGLEISSAIKKPENGVVSFLNPETPFFSVSNSVMITVFINSDLFLSRISDDCTSCADQLKLEFTKSFIASYLVEVKRFRRTEFLLSLIHALKAASGTSLNDLNMYRNGLFSEAGKKIADENVEFIVPIFKDAIYFDDGENKIIDSIWGLDPVDALKALEPLSSNICKDIEKLFDKGLDPCTSTELYKINSLTPISESIKRTLFIHRIIPILYYIVYFEGHGNRFNALNSIKSTFKKLLNEYKCVLSNGESLYTPIIELIEEIDFDKYDSFDKCFKNPLNTSSVLVDSIKYMVNNEMKKRGGE